MSVRTRWLAGRRPEARPPMHRARGLGGAVVAVELGRAQPIVATIDDNGRELVGLILEKGNVAVEVRVEDPGALRDELAEAIAWQQRERNGTPASGDNA